MISVNGGGASSRKSSMSRKLSSKRSSNLVMDNGQLLEHITSGVAATKYGRTGGFKAKIVKYNENNTSLEWADARTDRLRPLKMLFRLNSNNNVSTMSACGGGAAGAADGVIGSIATEDIREVCRGIQTDLLRKAGLYSTLATVDGKIGADILKVYQTYASASGASISGGVAINSNGVYLVGSTTGEFNGIPWTGAKDAFVMKLDHPAPTSMPSSQPSRQPSNADRPA